MIMISLNTISSCTPCTSGWKSVLRGQGKIAADDELFPVAAILDSNNLDDTLWTLRYLPEHDSLWLSYALWCAQQVRHLTTSTYTHCALDVAQKYSEGKATRDELRLAADDLYEIMLNGEASNIDRMVYYMTYAITIRSAVDVSTGAFAAYQIAGEVIEVMANNNIPCNIEAKLSQILTLGYWTEESP